MTDTEAPRQSSRTRKKRELSPDLPPPPPPPKIRKLTNAERMKAYRQKMKVEDPERYQQSLLHSRAKCKRYRASFTAEEKKKNSEMSKIRTQKCRKKKKEESKTSTKIATRQDLLATAAQRAKWRDEYKVKAENEHWRTKQARNARRREAYKQKRVSNKINAQISKEVQAGTGSSADVEDTRTPDAKRKALQRARDALPLSPTKFVCTVTDIIDKATPRKKALLNRSFDTKAQKVGRLFMEAIKGIKNKKGAADKVKRRVLLSVVGSYSSESIKCKSALLGIDNRTLVRSERQAMKKVKKEKLVQSLAATFIEDCAMQLPDKKLVSKKTGKAGSQLQKPLKELHKDFTEATGQSIGFSTFAKCRPVAVRKIAQSNLRQCLCEYCTNLKLKITTINAIATAVDQRCRIRNERHAVDLLTCDSKSKDCTYGTCDTCGEAQLRGFLLPLEQQPGVVKWYRWESKMVTSKGKEVSRKMLLSKRGTVQELIGQFVEEVKFLAHHLFRADWQLLQFKQQRTMKPFPPESVIMVLDFAENFSCTYKEEVQAAHWHHEQVTVHPSVTYYRCPAPGCEETVTESLVFISSDRKHDYHAVHHFNLMALQHLRGVRGLTVTHISQWTDGCAAQYKSKGPFADIACALGDLDATFQRNFFGSRHGKGPSDGESAVVKHSAATAVTTGRAIIASAIDLFEYCKGSLTKRPPAEGCLHFLRSFFWVGEEDVQRMREGRNVLTVPGTRSFHSVKCVEQGQIMARHLTCSCNECKTGVGHCSNGAVAGVWSTHSLRAPGQRRGRNARKPKQQAPKRQRRQGRVQQLRPRRLQICDPSVSDSPPTSPSCHSSPTFSDDPVSPSADIPGIDEAAAPIFPPPCSVSSPPRSVFTLDVGEMLPVDMTATGQISARRLLDDVEGTPVPPSVESTPLPTSSVESTPDESSHEAMLPALTFRTKRSESETVHKSRSIQCGSWVEKCYVAKRGQQERRYRGQVISYDEDTRQGTVKFLKQQGKYFIFPEKDDLDCGVPENELTLLVEPTMDSRMHYVFSE